MKKFYIDFRGYCEIEAETAQQAENEFWRLIGEDVPLPSNVYECEGVEENTD